MKYTSRIASLFLFFSGFLFLSSCASQPPAAPDWVSGASAQYKTAQYLIGQGQADSQEQAKDRARADLSKIFQVAINADSIDIQKYTSDPVAAEQYENQASRRITTRTEQIIRGIQIAELWQDPVNKTYHALAVLPRLQTASSLRQQISALDEATGKHVEQSRQQSDVFLKIAAASQAVDAQLERNALQRSLQIVDITGRGQAPMWDSTQLNNDLDELLKRVRIATIVVDGSVSGLEAVVAGAVAQAGFMIETGQHPDFVLQAQMKLADLGLTEGWYWQRGVLEVTLSEVDANRVRGSKRWNIKSNAPDQESALKRALNQTDAILKKELRSAIIDMANRR